MDRVIVKAGTKTNMYQLFEDLQNYNEVALRNVLQELFDWAGVNALTTINQWMDPADTNMLVTGVVGQNYISVGAGTGLTDNMNYIYVNPGTTVSLTTLSSGLHSLYLAEGTYYSDPVDVMSGFAYAQAGVSQQNSRAHHNSVFMWDTDPVGSGIWLADVTVSAGGVFASAVDKRQTNVLKIAQTVIPHNVMKIDAGYMQTLEDGLTLPDVTLGDTGTPGLLTLISGVYNTYLNYTRVKDLLDRIHTQNTDSGTTSSTFRIGNTTSSSSDGLLVLTEPDAPMPPKNVHISAVYSPTKSSVVDTEAYASMASAVSTGLLSHEATVSLEWNYYVQGDGGKGTGGITDSGKFRITGVQAGTATWIANELAGYHLYMPGTAKDYTIVSNLATSGSETVLTVTPYRHAVSIDGQSSYFAVIHSNCTSYEIVATPILKSGAPVPFERYEENVTMQSSPTAMQQTLNLFLGERVLIKIRAKNGTSYSEYTEMPAGSYTAEPPYTTVNNYSKPFYVALPQLDSTGAKVGANTTPSGFTMTIVGWDAATDFEICYTTDASGPDYRNETHEKFVTRQRSVDIVASGSRTYNIAVRPLISGWAVAPAKTTSVVSGSGGSTPKDTAYPITNISFKTYSGTMGAYDNTITYAWAISGSGIHTPAGHASAVTTIDDTIIGSYITIGGTYMTGYVLGGTDYVITDRIGQNVVICDLAGTEVTAGLTGQYFINTSKAGRVLNEPANFPLDVQITSVMVEQWTTPGRRGEHVPVIRWYQKSMEAYADSLPLSDRGNANYSQTTDVTVLAQNGNRTIVVDYWDPTLDDNISGFTGNITLYWKPYVATGRKTDNTSTPPITTQVS